MKIEAIPLLADNYAWLLHHPGGADCAVVDPSEAAPVQARLHAAGLRLRWILITHHHPDHTGGVAGLVGPGVEVVASHYDRDRVPCVTQTVADEQSLQVLGHDVRCLMVPGHTLGAVAYHIPEAAAVFTGDTLFTAGCGRLFEGTPEQMQISLHKLADLPAQTRVFCGHEYTEKNLQFAMSLEPLYKPVVERLKSVQAKRARGEPTVPELLEVECRTNPFLRVRGVAMQKVVGRAEPTAALAELRQRRDHF